MLGFIWRMIVGRFHSCHHNWKVVDQSNRVDSGHRSLGTLYTLRCEHCGEMKSFRDYQ